MKKFFLILTLLALSLLIVACKKVDNTEVKSAESTANLDKENVQANVQTEKKEEEAYQFEDIPLTLLDGTETSLYAYEGKTIVMNFWTTQCSYCSQMMPHLDALNQREDVVVLSVNSGGSKEEVEAYLKDKGYSFDVFLDEDAKLSNSFAIRGVPSTFFISPNYELYLVQPGLVEKEGLEEIMSRIESFEKNKKGE